MLQFQPLLTQYFTVLHTVLDFLTYFITSFLIAVKALTMNLHLILSGSYL